MFGENNLLMNDIVFKTEDLTYLSWDDKRSSSFGTQGCFLKTSEIIDNKRVYYKLSNYDSYRGVFGHECINELIVSRLSDILNNNHLKYELINANVKVDNKVVNTWLCRSYNFKNDNEQKIALETYYDIEKNDNESPEKFCSRMGWDEYIDEMLILDFVILNRDRHGANIEVLLDNDNNVRLAPLYDNGISLMFSCYNDIDSIKKFDVLDDKVVNNYLYTKSTKENLKYIKKHKKICIDNEKIDYIKDGIDKILPNEHIEKIITMIARRAEYYDEVYCKEL